MSSFQRPQRLYLFELKNGKKKICYGADPENALEIARIRLSEEEMAQIIPDRCEKILQRDLLNNLDDLA